MTRFFSYAQEKEKKLKRKKDFRAESNPTGCWCIDD